MKNEGCRIKNEKDVGLRMRRMNEEEKRMKDVG